MARALAAIHHKECSPAVQPSFSSPYKVDRGIPRNTPRNSPPSPLKFRRVSENYVRETAASLWILGRTFSRSTPRNGRISLVALFSAARRRATGYAHVPRVPHRSPCTRTAELTVYSPTPPASRVERVCALSYLSFISFSRCCTIFHRSPSLSTVLLFPPLTFTLRRARIRRTESTTTRRKPDEETRTPSAQRSVGKSAIQLGERGGGQNGPTRQNGVARRNQIFQSFLNRTVR